MEFEKNTPITDEQRVLASKRKVTIEPLTAGIVREETIDPPTIVEKHPNVERDSEDTAAGETLIHPSGAVAAKAAQPHSRLVGISIIAASLVVGIIGGALYFFIRG